MPDAASSKSQDEWADLGICVCGVATWVRVPDDGSIAYHPGKWYCQRCKRLHPLEAS